MQQNENKILIYQDDNGITKVNVRFSDEDVWLTQAQLAEIIAKRLCLSGFKRVKVEGKMLKFIKNGDECEQQCHIIPNGFYSRR